MDSRFSPLIAPVVAGGCAATFGADVTFLQRHTETVILTEEGGRAQLALCPRLQGRVATSTAAGSDGASFGWLNRDAIASGQIQEHINVYGGEDRFWIGPEGGQFAVFFARGVPQDLEHWFTPPPFDSEPFTLVEKGSGRALLRKTMRLHNASGTVFDLEVEREVRIVPRPEIWKSVGVVESAGVAVVGFESRNRITNKGGAAWRKETGLLSIWIVGMFPPSGHTTVVVPFRAGPESELGPVVNDAYFGKVPGDRLLVKGESIFYKADGQQRGKIGVSPRRARPVLGSYDADGGVLTLVRYTLRGDSTEYVNSMWEQQKEPFAGDALNSYNDGPPAPGKKPLGPFYELETSSAAAALAPGESAEHLHRTMHFAGDAATLDQIARANLGVGLADIKSVFAR